MNELLDNYLEEVQIEELGLGPVSVDHDWLTGRLIVTLSKDAQGVAGMAAAGAILVGGTLLAVKLISGSYRFYKDYLNKYGKKCRDIKHSTKARRLCESRVKITAYKKRIKGLNDSKKHCSKTKEPKKCTSKINSKVKKLNDELKMMVKKYTEAERFGKGKTG